MRLLLCIFVILVLPACGFKAVYKDDNPQKLNHDLSAIEIEPIDSIEGAEFCRYLEDILNSSGTTRFHLKAEFNSTTSPIAIQKDSDVLRQTVSQIVKYQLFDKQTGKELTGGSFKQMSSYNTGFSPFATYLESDMIGKNLARQSAEEIRTRLILYFDSKTD